MKGRRNWTSFALLMALFVGFFILTRALRLAGESISAPLEPVADAVFTSTRSVTALLFDANGALWVGTTGGVLRRSPSGEWLKFTRLDGLPSHETQSLRTLPNGGVQATFPTGVAAFEGQKWRVTARFSAATPPLPPGATCRPVEWEGGIAYGSTRGLTLQKGEAKRALPFPATGMGTHFSALLPRSGGGLLAVLYGDARLWEWTGAGWMPGPALPVAAREGVALAEHGDALILGTRHEGVWEWNGAAWVQHTMPDEPEDHNIQSLAEYDGALYAGTLEEGLLVRSASGWGRVAPPTLSSLAPRQMIVFHGALYVRHGDGKVDRLQSGVWSRDVFAAVLPRKRVSCMTTDGERLVLGQWGGWSDGDGGHWRHHLTVPALQGVTLTALCLTPADKGSAETLWIGTQGRGLAEADLETGAIRRWIDPRHGLPDDWVTALLAVKGRPLAGTFVGGVAADPLRRMARLSRRGRGERDRPRRRRQGTNLRHHSARNPLQR